MKYFSVMIALVAVLPFLSACESGIQGALGLDKQVPDEFRVVKREPLTLPPSFDLTPPTPGAPRPQESDATAQAKKTLLGDKRANKKAETTGGAEALLQKAGVGEADPNIRAKIDTEELKEVNENTPVAKRLLGIGPDPEDASVLNPKEEAARLKKESAAASIPSVPDAAESAAEQAAAAPARAKPLNVPPTSNAPDSAPAQ